MTRQRHRPIVFVLRLRSCRPEADNIRALKQILKRLLRSFRMRYVSVHEEHQRNLEFSQQRESSPDKIRSIAN